MLPARKNRFLQALLFAYIGRALRGQFDSIRLFGDGGGFADDAAYPLVFYSNHATWWDGFLEVTLVRRWGQDLWLMMEERNLRRFPFFRVAGVFGVDLADPRGGAEALRYAAKRLREGHPRRSLYLYPHGRLVAPGEPWPEFRGGLAALLRLVPQARAVPVAKVLAYGRFRDAEVYLEVGEPRRGRTAELEAALREVHARLVARVAGGDVAGAAWLLRPKSWSPGRTGDP